MLGYIQITKYIDPDGEIWYKGGYITNKQWLTIEQERLTKQFNKKIVIDTNHEGYQAIWREKLK